MPENINLFDINEILKLLRGTYPLPREYRSQFEPQQLNVPTETYAVLRDYIYRNAGCKLFFRKRCGHCFPAMLMMFFLVRRILRIV